VMDTSNVPMPGLYGAGEIMGGVSGIVELWGCVAVAVVGVGGRAVVVGGCCGWWLLWMQ
jgi:hypothetical protein